MRSYVRYMRSHAQPWMASPMLVIWWSGALQKTELFHTSSFFMVFSLMMVQEGETNCAVRRMHASTRVRWSCMSCILCDLKLHSFAQSEIMLDPSLASAHSSHGSTPAITYPSPTLAYTGSPTLRSNILPGSRWYEWLRAWLFAAACMIAHDCSWLRMTAHASCV